MNDEAKAMPEEERVKAAYKKIKYLIDRLEELEKQCVYCKKSHPGEKCPNVKGLDYYRNGKIKAIHLFNI
jgi:hypothetical protein